MYNSEKLERVTIELTEKGLKYLHTYTSFNRVQFDRDGIYIEQQGDRTLLHRQNSIFTNVHSVEVWI